MVYESDQRRPVCFTIQKEGQQRLNWDSSLRLLYLIEGEAELQTRGQTFYLREQDVFVVNPYEMYSLHGKEPVILCVTLKTNLLTRNLSEKTAEKIECGSCMVPDPRELAPLKNILRKIIQNETEGGAFSEIKNQILAWSLWEELLEKFGSAEEEKKESGEVGYQKMEGILEYINQHYREELTLQRMSEVSFLTRTYFSRMFRKYTGINFSRYLTNLRLSYAVQDVLYTQDEMERISARHGFSNARAFSRAFREYYEMLPSEYRRSRSSRGGVQRDSAVRREGEYLKKLLAQLGEDVREPKAHPEKAFCRVRLPEISAGQEGYPLKHNEWAVIHAGTIRRLLAVSVQRQIREAQRFLHFAYAQVEGPWDGSVSSFEADQAMDFLTGCGFRPWICLGEFGDEKIVRSWLRHWKARYGGTDGWIFETANERIRECLAHEGATTAGSAFGQTEPTGNASGKAESSGTASGKAEPEGNASGKTRPTGSAFGGNRPSAGLLDILTLRHCPSGGRLEDSENALKEQIYDWKKLLKEEGLSKKRQYLTGFRPFPEDKNPLCDSVYYACYLVKNLLENYDRLDAYCLGGISDYAEDPAAENEFDGVFGLMTRNGIKKPAFYACRLLRRLGDVMIAKGDGYFVTKSGDSIRMLLYHYIHFSPLVLSAAPEARLEDEGSLFPDACGKRMVLRVTDLLYEEYRVTDTYINRRHGSAFDLWRETGRVPVRDEKDADYYNGLSQPLRKTEKVKTEHGGISLIRDLAPQEIRLIELSPCGKDQKSEKKGREN